MQRHSAKCAPLYTCKCIYIGCSLIRSVHKNFWRYKTVLSPSPSQVEGKTLPEVTEYYYYWKKYCSDEYRGRNRHISEEVHYIELYLQSNSS